MVAERREHFLLKTSEKLMCEKVRKIFKLLAEIYFKLTLNKQLTK